MTIKYYVSDKITGLSSDSKPTTVNIGAIFHETDTAKIFEYNGSSWIESTDHTKLSNIGSNTHSQIDSHLASTSNPHSTTALQIGLGSLTNDTQVKKIASSVSDNLISWNGTTGDTPKDSGISSSSVSTTISNSHTHSNKSNLDTLNQNISNTDSVTFGNITDSGLTASKVVFTDATKKLTSIGIGSATQFIKGDGSLDTTNYQPLLTNPITGTGTQNYIPKFTNTSIIGNSLIYDTGTSIGIGATIPVANLEIYGSGGSDGATARLGKSNNEAFLEFGGQTNNYAAIDNISGGGIRFYTGNGTLTEKMRIGATGIVNINNLTASKVVFTDASKNLISTGIGTSSQFIKGDGSLDSNTYLTSLTGALLSSNNLSDVTTRQTALNNLTAVSSATNEHILTKDTSTGNAIFKAAPSGMIYPGAGIPNSTGSAWGTSYTTSGSGTTVALNNSPILTTPIINGQSVWNDDLGVYIGNNRCNTNYIEVDTDNICSVIDTVYLGSTSGASYGAISGSGKYQISAKYGGFFYLSTDYGKTWTQKGSALNYQAAAISASGKYQLVAAYSSNYVYLSTNYGATFSQTSCPAYNWQSAAISANGKYMYVGAWGGVSAYYSTDYGSTWAQSTVTGGVYVNSISISADGKYVLFAPYTGNTLQLSTNYGASFSTVGSVGNTVGCAMSSNGQYMFVTEQSTTLNYSTNYGASFSTRTLPITTDGIDCDSSGRIVVIGNTSQGNMYVSTDYGVTWTAKGAMTGAKRISMSSNAKYILITTQTGVLVHTISNPIIADNCKLTNSIMDNNISINKTTIGQEESEPFIEKELVSTSLINTLDADYGLNWVSTNISSNNRAIAVSSSGQYQTVAITSGYLYRSKDYGVTWAQVGSSLNWYAVSMSATGKYQTAVASGSTIWVSTDYGATWNAKDASQSWWSVSVSSTGKYQIASVNGGYYYLSNDYGNTWSQKTSTFDSWRGTSISADGKYIFVGRNGQHVISTDYGNTWSNAGTSTNNLTAAMSADGKYIIYGSNANSVYLSSNYGTSFSTTSLTSGSYYGLAISANGKYMAVGVNGGYIFVSKDYGSTWSQVGSSLNWQSIGISSNGKFIAATANGSYTYISTMGNNNYGNLQINNGYLALTKGTAVASATTITPTGGIFHVTGTTAIATINIPYTGFNGQIIIIPDAIFSTTTAGNIALASTAVVNKALIMTYDATAVKWYPSY